MVMTHEISNIAQTSTLQGKTILVTRAVHQAEEFSSALRALGANVVEFPTIRIGDPDSWEDLDRCIQKLDQYHGIIFTSANAVEKFFQRVHSDTRSIFREKTLYAVGVKTQEALRTYHDAITIIPEQFTANGLLAMLKTADVEGKRFLHPRGNRSRDIVRNGLEKFGALIDECIVYKTEYANPSTALVIHDMLENKAVHLITFFSPSSVEGFFQSMLSVFPNRESLSTALRGVQTAVIGTVTAEALQMEGISPTIIPSFSTSEDLIESIIRLYKK